MRIITLIFILLIGTLQPIQAQESVIDLLMDSRQSIVEIKAIQMGIIGKSKPSARFNPKTRKMMIASSVRSGYYEQKGAGVVISSDGLIVTNLHVVQGATNIGVVFFNGDLLWATIVEISAHDDLALLHIESDEPLRPIPFANSDKVVLSEPVINIGNSPLLKETISGGRVTTLGKSPLTGEVEVIQVNINLYKGDSGGPLLNNNGELIGMIVAKRMSKNNATFAIPANKIKKLYLKAKE